MRDVDASEVVVDGNLVSADADQGFAILTWLLGGSCLWMRLRWGWMKA